MTTEQIKAMILCDLFDSEEFHEGISNPLIGCEYTYEALKEILLSIRGVNCPSTEVPGAFPIMNKETAYGKLYAFAPYEDKKPVVIIKVTYSHMDIKSVNHHSILKKGRLG